MPPEILVIKMKSDTQKGNQKNVFVENENLRREK